MPPHSRQQRRRQNVRQQQRSNPPRSPQTQPRSPEATVADVAPEARDAAYIDVAVPRIETPRASAPRAAVTTGTTRRLRTRPAAEPVDYSADYRAARRDLRLIALWAVLLFAVMLALKVSGIV